MKSILRIRIMSLLVGIILTLGFFNLTLAIDYPTRAIEYILPTGAGGSTATGARIIAQGASELLGKTVVVINKPGAGTTIGATYAAKQKPDGYTLFNFNSASNGAAPATRSKLGYSNDDFEIICQYGELSMVFTVRQDSPFKSVKDVVEYAKNHPHAVKCGNAGLGTAQHLVLELFNLEAGIKIDAVPFKSGGEELASLMGGHTQLYFPNPPYIKGFYQAGKVRLLAVFDPKRFDGFPDVPTMPELGYPGVVLGTWFGVAVPRGVPKDILDKLKDVFRKTAQNPEIQTMLKNAGFTPRYRNAEEFKKFVNEEAKVYQRLAKECNIKIE